MARALDITRAATVQGVGPAHGPADALRRHWPEYLIEAGGLCLFMVSAGLFGCSPRTHRRSWRFLSRSSARR